MSTKPLGRSTGQNPPNRFHQLHLESDTNPLRIPTRFLVDISQSILAENDSPDLPFRYSVNPYRGCEHGCIYCYARPSHEFLGFSAGLDFETQILVKRNSPFLLRQSLGKPSWIPQSVALSGNTDCYQPIERKLKLSRSCLEVFLDFRNPVSIITKNHLVTRDTDILSCLADQDLVHVVLSITTLDDDLHARMEPRTSSPSKRLHAVQTLAEVGVPVGVNLAPVIAGLNEEEIPDILQAARDSGASWANYILLRLPGPVSPLFQEWLGRNYPNRVQKVLNGLKRVRNGKLSDSKYGSRMRGTGSGADLLQSYFEMSRRKVGFGQYDHTLRTDLFRLPSDRQLTLEL